MDKISLTPSAYQTIVTHALTHDKEEVMGLLFAEQCGEFIQIYSAKPCKRITHLPDRVEMSGTELAEGIQEAERLTKILNKNIRVLGWYHSHPHTTVHPSLYDIEAQRAYEELDPKFFGIIVSVFNECIEKQQTIQITSFRSNGENSTKLAIEPISRCKSLPKLDLFQINIENWRSVPAVLFSEIEAEPAYDRIAKITQLSMKTALPMATMCGELCEKLQSQDRLEPDTLKDLISFI